MKTAGPRYHRRGDPSGLGPWFGFALALFASFVVWSCLTAMGSGQFLMPVVATMFLVFAAGFGLIAWRTSGEDTKDVTYADVAGSLTLIGLAAAATIDPDQLVRLVETNPAESFQPHLEAGIGAAIERK